MTTDTREQTYSDTATLTQAIAESHHNEDALFCGMDAVLQLFHKAGDLTRDVGNTAIQYVTQGTGSHDSTLAAAVTTLLKKQFYLHKQPSADEYEEYSWMIMADCIEHNVDTVATMIPEYFIPPLSGLHGNPAPLGENRYIAEDRVWDGLTFSDGFMRQRDMLDTVLNYGKSVVHTDENDHQVQDLLHGEGKSFRDLHDLVTGWSAEVEAPYHDVYALLTNYHVAHLYYLVAFEDMVATYLQRGAVDVQVEWLEILMLSCLADAIQEVDTHPEYITAPVLWRHHVIPHHLPTEQEFAQYVRNIEKLLYA